ncbi:hypothetical protein J4465_01670 [Candidatus Pacearchaeota archaeon]|nr:hypothetical protein [Candidatus Pacearchaeota archaeon]
MIHPGNILNTFNFYEYLESDYVVIDEEDFDSKKRKYGVILDVYCELDTQMISLKHSGGERDIPSNSILLRPANLLEKSTKFKRLKKLSQIVDD